MVSGGRRVRAEGRGEREVVAPSLDRQQVGLDRLRDQLVAELEALVAAARRGSRDRSPRPRRRGGPRRGRRRRAAGGSWIAAAGRRRGPRTSWPRPRARRGPAAARPGRGGAARAGLGSARRASRARTSSSSVEPSDSPGSSRRAASTSSAMSGSPPERSATSSRAAAVGRSPSISVTSWARSKRSSGPSSSCVGGSDAPVIEASCGWQRVAARDPVRAVGQEQAQPRGARDAGEERREVAGPGVGVMEVLEDEQDRLALPCPLEQALDRLADPGARGAPGRSTRDGRAESRPRAAARFRAAGARSARRPDRRRARSSSSPSDCEPRREPLDDRPVGGAAPGRHRRAADDLERLLSRPTRRTASSIEPAHADATAPRHEQARAAAVGRRPRARPRGATAPARAPRTARC